jgi:hypothetical protein
VGPPNVYRLRDLQNINSIAPLGTLRGRHCRKSSIQATNVPSVINTPEIFSIFSSHIFQTRGVNHSPIKFTVGVIPRTSIRHSLTEGPIKLNVFQTNLDNSINLNIFLKYHHEIEIATKIFTKIVTNSAVDSVSLFQPIIFLPIYAFLLMKKDMPDP